MRVGGYTHTCACVQRPEINLKRGSSGTIRLVLGEWGLSMGPGLVCQNGQLLSQPQDLPVSASSELEVRTQCNHVMGAGD